MFFPILISSELKRNSFVDPAPLIKCKSGRSVPKCLEEFVKAV